MSSDIKFEDLPLSDEEDLEGVNSPGILDWAVWGRRLRALRVLRGFDRVSDFATAVQAQYGVNVTARTVYAIERGEQPPHFDLVLAIFAMLEPEPGYFFSAYRDDVAMRLQRQYGGTA